MRFVAGKYLILVLLGILTEGGESIQGLIFVRIILSPHLTYGLLQCEQKLISYKCLLSRKVINLI